MGNNVTVCDYMAMLLGFQGLAGVIKDLEAAHEMTKKLMADLEEAYEGEAKEEIGIFLESLSVHIFKLELFYSKMMEFIKKTSQSFMENDAAMTENMGKR